MRRRLVPAGRLARSPVPAYIVWLDHTTADDNLPTWVERGKVVPESEEAEGGAVSVQSCCYVFEEHDESLVIAHSVSRDPCEGHWEAVQTFIVVKRAIVEFRLLAADRKGSSR